MIGVFLLLVVTVFGVMVLFGKAKTEQIFKFALVLIFAPVLLAVGYNHALWFWDTLSLWVKVLIILLLPFFVSTLLQVMFPGAKWLQQLQAIVFQTLLYVVTFPIRFLWRAEQFFCRRERRGQQLDPYRPVVGAKPALRQSQRQESQENNLFD